MIFCQIGFKNQIHYFQVFLSFGQKMDIWNSVVYIFKHLISFFYSARPRILVVTGDGDSPKKMQLWPKPDSQCALPADYPLEVSGAVGFWTAQGPTPQCVVVMENARH